MGASQSKEAPNLGRPSPRGAHKSHRSYESHPLAWAHSGEPIEDEDDYELGKRIARSLLAPRFWLLAPLANRLANNLRPSTAQYPHLYLQFSDPGQI